MAADPREEGYLARRNRNTPTTPCHYPAGSPEEAAFAEGVAEAVREWVEDNERERMQQKYGSW